VAARKRDNTSSGKSAGADQICDRCGAHNVARAGSCASCGGTRFAPAFVRELRRVNRAFAVQVVEPYDAAEDPRPRLSLYRGWPQPKSFSIVSAEQWEAVKAIVDTELAPFLGWKSRRAVAQALKEQRERADELTDDVKEVIAQNPALIAQIVAGIDLERVTDEDIPQIGRALGEIARIFTDADYSLRLAIERVVKKLPSQGERAVQQLGELMESLTLSQIAAVTGEVRRRINLLNLFKERVLDERTYEIRGDGSIHRLLEQAMWIVDERYWLMHSNSHLRTVVGKDLAKQDKRFEQQRPDFVCGSVDNKLIIIEIKRPSHTLEVDDLNQLETYVRLCNKYDDDHSTFDAYLVGNRQSDDLRETLKLRRETFKVRTYTQLIKDTERRYEGYLQAREPAAA
jgi:hypothetical protein